MGNKRIYELAKELKNLVKTSWKSTTTWHRCENHMGAITSNDEKKLQQAFKTQARNNKLHNKQAENQPINSRTINVKRNNEQSTKIK